MTGFEEKRGVVLRGLGIFDPRCTLHIEVDLLLKVDSWSDLRQDYSTLSRSPMWK